MFCCPCTVVLCNDSIIQEQSLKNILLLKQYCLLSLLVLNGMPYDLRKDEPIAAKRWCSKKDEELLNWWTKGDDRILLLRLSTLYHDSQASAYIFNLARLIKYLKEKSLYRVDLCIFGDLYMVMLLYEGC